MLVVVGGVVGNMIWSPDQNFPFTLFPFSLFKNSTPHFLDNAIASDGLGIYRKNAFTGQYTNFEGF